MNQISVLIIEDSIYSADLNVREIKKAGFTVRYQRVSNGKSMLKVLKEGLWDIILSDNSMPGFSALQALELRNSFAGNVPFIIVSEDISNEDISRALKFGCTYYISKENLPQLREVIKKIFCSERK